MRKEINLEEQLDTMIDRALTLREHRGSEYLARQDKIALCREQILAAFAEETEKTRQLVETGRRLVANVGRQTQWKDWPSSDPMRDAQGFIRDAEAFLAPPAPQTEEVPRG